jgi:hypothetical protein
MAAQLSAGLVITTGAAEVAGFVVRSPAGEPTGAVRDVVVVAGPPGVMARVEQLQVAGVDAERLVRVAADNVAVEDVGRPGCSTVRFAGKRVRNSGDAAEGGGGEGAEVASVGALSLGDHEVLVLALDGVHLHGPGTGSARYQT